MAKHFIRMIKKYIQAYVQCDNCKGLGTTIEKENRLNILKCSKCKAHRTVQGIQSQYRAVKRGERKKERAK